MPKGEPDRPRPAPGSCPSVPLRRSKTCLSLLGLGTHDRIQSRTGQWPNGRQSTYQDLTADRFYTIYQDTNPPPATPPPAPIPPTRFRPSQALAGLAHQDPSFDDFARQPLLPWRLSEPGPGMAWGDINNDGLDDLYVSGTRKKPGRLLLREASASFQPHPTPIPAPLADEMAPLFFDANGDGFLDLFIVTGSTECESNDPSLRDRLFLNDGTGRLSGGAGLLLLGNGDGTFVPIWPNHSGIIIPGEARSLTTADLDGDDSIDFVVGINHAQLLAFENSITSANTNRTLTLQLQGPTGNPTAVGARVILHLKNGTRQATEVYAGGGFLSQAGAILRFGLGATSQVERLEVFWPHGARSSHDLPPGQSRLQIRQPSP